jgi:proteasome lid subunit RPN8/RPN11
MQPATLYLTPAQLESIQAQMAQSLKREVCGLIGGVWQPYPRKATAHEVVAISNSDPQPSHRFRMSPPEQLAAMLHFHRQGWQTVAIYHSHPHGPLVPSASDIAEWNYSDALCMIGLPSGEVGVWRIAQGKALAAMLVIYP